MVTSSVAVTSQSSGLFKRKKFITCFRGFFNKVPFPVEAAAGLVVHSTNTLTSFSATISAAGASGRGTLPFSSCIYWVVCSTPGIKPLGEWQGILVIGLIISEQRLKVSILDLLQWLLLGSTWEKNHQ